MVGKENGLGQLERVDFKILLSTFYLTPLFIITNNKTKILKINAKQFLYKI